MTIQRRDLLKIAWPPLPVQHSLLRWRNQAAERRIIGNTPNPSAGPATVADRPRGGILLGREPHEPTFTRNGKELWVTLRGEDRIAILDVERALAQLKGADTSAIRQFLPTLNGPSRA